MAELTTLSASVADVAAARRILPPRQPRPAPTPAATAPPPHQDGPRPGRAHVQQTVHGMERAVRHAIAEQTRDQDLPSEALRDLQELRKSFREELQDAVGAAGDGSRVDRTSLFDGIIGALQNLTAGLRELNAPPEAPQDAPRAASQDAARTPVATPPLEQPVPESPELPRDGGHLVDSVA